MREACLNTSKKREFWKQSVLALMDQGLPSSLAVSEADFIMQEYEKRVFYADEAPAKVAPSAG